MRRVDVSVVGATMSDANPGGIVPGAQYAQANPTPVISAEDMHHIRERHFFDSSATSAGKFTPEYSSEEAIRRLVEDAWAQATPEDTGPGRWSKGLAVIGAQVLDIVDGVPRPHIIGISAEGMKAPSIPTCVYVVVIDANNNVKSIFPINTVDGLNPRGE